MPKVITVGQSSKRGIATFLIHIVMDNYCQRVCR
jgi:hypothetical protein